MDLQSNQEGYLKGKKDYRVNSISWKGYYKKLSVGPIKKKPGKAKVNPIFICVPLSSCVTKGDIIYREKKDIFVRCINKDVQIYPYYNKNEELKIGGLTIASSVKEITTKDEQEEYKALAKFHYRDEHIFGSTAKLIIRSKDPTLPHVLGYIELASPFYMNKPRSILFNNKYKNNGISWDKWDHDTQRRYTNIVTRISRCVIHPEFRGAGLAQVLVREIIEFAKSRWQLGNYTPYFLEISADMLRYVSFASKAGMHFIGNTEGNLNRVASDMSYLTKNVNRVRSGEIVQENSFGIVDQQVAKMERFLSLVDELGVSKEELLKKLDKLKVDDVLRDYALFHNIVSLPKPTYMIGLNSYSEGFIKENLKKLKLEDKTTSKTKSICVKPTLRIEEVSLSYRSNVRRTKATHAVQQAFGISPDEIENKIIDNLSLEVNSGDVILITGPSGSGKTSLLNLFAKKQNANLKISGSIKTSKNARIGVFNEIQSEKALVEYFNNKDVNQSISLLSSVGLSDAYLFLKRYKELSKGQQFRAKLADLINKESNIWLIDEFCTNLDEVTASIVSEKAQKIARKKGVILLVAAANYKHFVRSLRPNKVLYINSSWHHNIIDGDKFIRACE